MTRRVAAVDCGTNSIRLLIADVDRARGVLTDVRREMKIVRLGEGVDKTGRLSAAALDRTIGALRGYAASIGQSGVSAVDMVATSATRDASNSAEFVSRVVGVLGVAPRVLTGDAEARLSFAGATRELSEGSPYLVVDIGGGSTEFVLGDSDEPSAAISVDIGCVRMTERHLHTDPPTDAEIAAASADIDDALDLVEAAVPGASSATLVGLAGSVTTVAGIAMGLSSYDERRLHHSRTSAAQVHHVTESLLGMPRAERSMIGLMHPGRVDVIGGGAMVLDKIMSRFGFAEVLASEHDILDGIAWSLTGGVPCVGLTPVPGRRRRAVRGRPVSGRRRLAPARCRQGQAGRKIPPIRPLRWRARQARWSRSLLRPARSMS